MKTLFALIALALPSFALADEPACPSLAGEYVAGACPAPKTAFQTVLIRQTDCRNIAFQALRRDAKGVVIQYGPIRWESVGGGRLEQREDASTIYSRETFFSGTTLYSYNYRTARSTGATTLVNAELISMLQLNNLFISNSELGQGRTWFFLPNCKP